MQVTESLVQSKMSKQSSVISAMKSLSLLSQIGISMVANILVGLFIGKFLDELLNTSPLFLLLFVFVGVGSGIKSTYVLITKMNRSDTNEQIKK